MSGYWSEVKRAFVIVSGVFNWGLYLLLFEMVRSQLLTDPHRTLVLMWIIAALAGLRAVLYTTIPHGDRPSYELRDFHFFEIHFFDLRVIADRIHNLIVFFINPYLELCWFLIFIPCYYILSFRF